MVSPIVVLLMVATVSFVVASYALAEPEERRSNRYRAILLLQFGSMAAVTALVGFEGTFGIVDDPGLPGFVGDGLLAVAGVALLAALMLWSR